MPKFKIAIVLSVIFTFITPQIVSAAVTLPWSTTYNCSEWTYPASLSCDGLTVGGGWHTRAGSNTQITSAANYPGGGGGRGYRLWEGEGNENMSGPLAVQFAVPPPEVWIRFYARFESGFEFSPMSFQKWIYMHTTAGKAPCIRIVANGISMQQQPSPPDVIFSGGGWNQIYPGGVSNGSWHSFEFHMKMNSSGADGVLEYWLDGNRINGVSNIDYGGGNFSWFMNIENAFTVKAGSPDRYIDWDDLAISTTGYIGPLSATPDTTPPSVPTNLSATAISSSQINLSWTVSTDNVGVTGYRIYRNSTQIGTSAVNSYSDTGLPPSTTYIYTVAAYDAAGNVSGQSSSASATTQAPADTTPPSAPTGVTVS